MRDWQAHAYLAHGKFPTQIAIFRDWLGQIQTSATRTNVGVALDLGCASGPYTTLLRDAGYATLAVDYSAESLRINSSKSQLRSNSVADYVQENLNDLRIKEQSTDLVLMADFLQHMGSRLARQRILHEALGSLRPGCPFYLSFFLLNITNVFRGDIHGSFSAGGDIVRETLYPERPTGSSKACSGRTDSANEYCAWRQIGFGGAPRSRRSLFCTNGGNLWASKFANSVNSLMALCHECIGTWRRDFER